MNTTQYIQISTSMRTKEEAQIVATTLVTKNYCACVQVLSPILSIYTWEGALHKKEETLLLIKTTTAHVENIMLFLEEKHPYSVPECIIVPITGGSPKYLQWIDENT